MKILIYSDVHWSTNSSLIRTRGNEFSTRLEHLISSMNWVNELAVEKGCDCMVCAGDFMDKAQLTDEEITALRKIKWNDLPGIFLCGNHESSVSDLRYSSLKAIEGKKRTIIDKPMAMTSLADCDIVFIPYILETDRKPLLDYLKGLETEESADLTGRKKPLVIFSHNDIAGISYGGFESKIGFSVTEIENCCDLYLNGHLHNSEWITKKTLNVGSLTAHNFTNDSSRYKYGVWILDTSDLSMTFYDNPHGFHFYKFEIASAADFKKIDHDNLGDNAVLSIKCAEPFVQELRAKLVGLAGKVLESRVTVVKQVIEDNGGITIAELQSDHLGKFVDFCKANIANSAILEAELAEVCK